MKRTISIIIVSAALLGCSDRPQGDIESSSGPNSAASPTATPDRELQGQIFEIAKAARGKVGVNATILETGETIGLDQNERFAMQSVVKVPIAMAVLKKVDQGKMELGQTIRVEKRELVPSNMRSPFREQNPNGGEATVKELIRLAIVESDGTAADVLQRLAGGANAVQEYLDSLGIVELEVRHSHKEFGAEWDMQYENWASPAAAVALLTALWDAANEKAVDTSAESADQGIDTAALSRENADLLMGFMSASNNPPNRLKAGLPLEAKLAHKTGTGGTRNGITAATNDIGIFKLPDGRHVAIAVLIGDSAGDLASREGTIASIARAIYEKWSNHTASNPKRPTTNNERHILN